MTIWIPEINKTGKPIYISIADGIEEDIESGLLKPGDRLPPQRDLAEALGVTIGTVTRAYAEARRRELLCGEVGRGTFITEKNAFPAPLSIQPDTPSNTIDLSLNHPLHEEAPDLSRVLTSLAGDPSISELLQCQPAAGTLRHRAAGASWIGKYGLTCDPDRVIVCAGAQHALTIVLATMASPGDIILAEELTYPGLKTLAHLLNLKLAPVAIDDEGLVPEALEAALQKQNVKAVYTTPTLHNPTTGTLSQKRRELISELLRKYEAFLIEDDVHGLLLPQAPPPISSFIPEQSYFIAGTSKTLAGGLRTAYLHTPKQAYQSVMHAVAATIWMSAPLMAEIAARWIEDGTADRVIETRQKKSIHRYALAVDIMKKQSFRSEPTALHMWLYLPQPWTGHQFAMEAFQRGVSVTPAESFVIGASHVPAAARISLSGARNIFELEKSLGTLAEMLEGPPDSIHCIF